MQSIGLVLRWIGAVLTAAIAFTIVYAIGGVVHQRFGTDPVSTMQWMTIGGAALAVLCGTLVVPSKQRKIASLALGILVCAVPLWIVLQESLGGRFSFPDFEVFCWALLGGSSVYIVARTGAFGGKRINRVAGRAE